MTTLDLLEYYFYLTRMILYLPFQDYTNKSQNKKNFRTIKIRSDHGTEFDNQNFEKFCIENRIDHNFSAPRTPQQNEVVERKNRTLVDIARIMFCETEMPKYF